MSARAWECGHMTTYQESNWQKMDITSYEAANYFMGNIVSTTNIHRDLVLFLLGSICIQNLSWSPNFRKSRNVLIHYWKLTISWHFVDCRVYSEMPNANIKWRISIRGCLRSKSSRRLCHSKTKFFFSFLLLLLTKLLHQNCFLSPNQ